MKKKTCCYLVISMSYGDLILNLIVILIVILILFLMIFLLFHKQTRETVTID
jgi:hypothetical protein